jgi:hypothetical protein
MIDKKIYVEWAFKENETEKALMNRQIHKDLTAEYRVYRRDTDIVVRDGTDCTFSEYDIVIGRKAGYNHALYRIYKNLPGLSQDELALLCDHGNLCFGYTMKGKDIYVFED